MTDPDHHSLGDEEFLTVRIGGTPQASERLLLVGRPQDGSVRVREWTTESLNSEGDDYEIDAAELLESIEAAYADRRSLGTELYNIRRWLEG
ncbi:MAG: hypothetical protein U0132_15155 [Gemmatimonadaceae bacterium]